MGINERERLSQVIDDLSEVCKFPPKAIKLEVSSECNFNCRICYSSK
jgi:MoaA/NifB/PqqE/SkfB family radical SAM enzyme